MKIIIIRNKTHQKTSPIYQFIRIYANERQHFECPIQFVFRLLKKNTTKLTVCVTKKMNAQIKLSFYIMNLSNKLTPMMLIQLNKANQLKWTNKNVDLIIDWMRSYQPDLLLTISIIHVVVVVEIEFYSHLSVSIWFVISISYAWTGL